jgi:hypothetical protein
MRPRRIGGFNAELRIVQGLVVILSEGAIEENNDDELDVLHLLNGYPST